MLSNGHGVKSNTCYETYPQNGHPPKRMSARTLFQRVTAALSDAEVVVDKERSILEFTGPRCVRIAIHCIPMVVVEDATEVTLIESAIHCVVQDELEKDVEWSRSTIHVQVYWLPKHSAPLCKESDTTNDVPAVQWIASNFHILCTHMLQGAAIALQEAFTRIIQQYPWRDRDAMILRAQNTLEYYVKVMLECGMSPKALASACDELLPPFEVLLPEYDRAVVYQWMTMRVPKILTRLQFYTTLYGCSFDKTTPPAVLLMYSRLFVVAP